MRDVVHRLGHEVDRLSVDKEVLPIVAQLQSFQPDLVFNLIESFNDKSALGSNVTAQRSYTRAGYVCEGCLTGLFYLNGAYVDDLWFAKWL